MNEKEQQFERIYKKTKDFDRTQFVREIQMQINDNLKKDKEINRLNNIIDELKEDIPCLLEIITRNENDIKIYQDEWIAVRSIEETLKERVN